MTNNDMTTPPAEADGGYFSEESATFGDRIAAARRATGLNQETLSRKLGIKLKTLQSWENDVSEPRANKLQMLAGVLNISIIWVLTGEGEGVRDPWKDGDPVVTDLSEVIADIRVIRAEHRRLGERMARMEKRLMALTVR